MWGAQKDLRIGCTSTLTWSDSTFSFLTLTLHKKKSVASHKAYVSDTYTKKQRNGSPRLRVSWTDGILPPD